MVSPQTESSVGTPDCPILVGEILAQVKHLRLFLAAIVLALLPEAAESQTTDPLSVVRTFGSDLRAT